MRTVVVLPEPDGPMTPRMVPDGIVNEISSMASWSAKRMVAPSMTTTDEPVSICGASTGLGLLGVGR